MKDKKQEDQFASKKSILDHFNRLLLSKIHLDIEKFLSKFDHTLNNVHFECDDDMRPVIPNWKLQHVREGKAYQLADALAYFCKMGKPPLGCIKLDLETELKAQMKKDLFK